MSRKKKNAERQRQSTRQLIGIDGISEYSLLTGHGELVFFSIRPTNISVLSDSSVAARIYALMTVLKGMAEIEMLCINSRENFEDNKTYLKARTEAENLPAVRKHGGRVLARGWAKNGFARIVLFFALQTEIRVENVFSR